MTDKITYEELMAELDKYRGRPPQSTEIFLTPQQVEFFKKCRETDPPVSYGRMAELWGRLGWGKRTHKSMKALYYKKVRGK